jgi:hypothetical protein
MLFCFFFNNRFILLVQSNFYIDFFLKKLCEVFIRNTLIYSAQFFGEKYIIEVLTKKIIDSFLYTSNKFFNIYTFNYNLFFYFIILISFYTLVIMFLFFFIF